MHTVVIDLRLISKHDHAQLFYIALIWRGICRVCMSIIEISCIYHTHILRKCLTTAWTLLSKKATCLGENEAQLEKMGSLISPVTPHLDFG